MNQYVGFNVSDELSKPVCSIIIMVGVSVTVRDDEMCFSQPKCLVRGEFDEGHSP